MNYKIREVEVEKYLKKKVEEMGGMCMKFTSSISGVPDRVILLPGGKVCFIEVKRKGMKPRRQQIKKILQIDRLGTRATWVDSKERVEEVLSEVCS
nr:nuclease [Burkholderiaceae bacterium]